MKFDMVSEPGCRHGKSAACPVMASDAKGVEERKWMSDGADSETPIAARRTRHDCSVGKSGKGEFRGGSPVIPWDGGIERRVSLSPSFCPPIVNLPEIEKRKASLQSYCKAMDDGVAHRCLKTDVGMAGQGSNEKDLLYWSNVWKR